MHDAGAALRRVAADMRSGEPEMLAQKMNQQAFGPRPRRLRAGRSQPTILPTCILPRCPNRPVRPGPRRQCSNAARRSISTFRIAHKSRMQPAQERAYCTFGYNPRRHPLPKQFLVTTMPAKYADDVWGGTSRLAGGGIALVCSRTSYACGVSTLTSDDPDADEFARAVADEAAAIDAGFALVFFSQSLLDAHLLASSPEAACAKPRPCRLLDRGRNHARQG